MRDMAPVDPDQGNNLRAALQKEFMTGSRREFVRAGLALAAIPLKARVALGAPIVSLKYS
jgi:hypothetical protein